MSKNYDYIIIGGGLAGLQLALKMVNTSFFNNKSIAVIEPSSKEENDKTWCFWEKGKGQWEQIIYKSWDTAKFFGQETEVTLPLAPYSYKMIRSEDFYNYSIPELKSRSNFHWIQDNISELKPDALIAVGEKNSYRASHIFDSRIDAEYLEDMHSTKLFQHFKGYIIQTPSKIFDDREFTMMDYRLKFKDSTSFSYVLPLEKNKALVEFTFFTPYLTEEKIYDTYLKNYMDQYLGVENYKILETEKGIIPMTDYAFHKHNSKNITKIGTAGGWVKGSTGYSFKHTEKKVTQIVENLENGDMPSKDLFDRKYKFYDAIFLDVLEQRNELGEDLFYKFYTKNSPELLLKYLDEETNLIEDLKIMTSLFHPQFIKSFFRKLF